MLLHLYMSLVIVIHVAILLRNSDCRVVWSVVTRFAMTTYHHLRGQFGTDN